MGNAYGFCVRCSRHQSNCVKYVRDGTGGEIYDCDIESAVDVMIRPASFTSFNHRLRLGDNEFNDGLLLIFSIVERSDKSSVAATMTFPSSAVSIGKLLAVGIVAAGAQNAKTSPMSTNFQPLDVLNFLQKLDISQFLVKLWLGSLEHGQRSKISVCEINTYRFQIFDPFLRLDIEMMIILPNVDDKGASVVWVWHATSRLMAVDVDPPEVANRIKYQTMY